MLEEFLLWVALLALSLFLVTPPLFFIGVTVAWLVDKFRNLYWKMKGEGDELTGEPESDPEGSDRG